MLKGEMKMFPVELFSVRVRNSSKAKRVLAVLNCSMVKVCTQADSGKDDNVTILGIHFSMPAISIGVGYASLRNPLSQSQTVGDWKEDSLESRLQTSDAYSG